MATQVVRCLTWPGLFLEPHGPGLSFSYLKAFLTFWLCSGLETIMSMLPRVQKVEKSAQESPEVAA